MNQEYQSIREKMQSYYDSGATLSYASRKAVLLKLRQTLKKWEEKLNEAVFLDLSKTTFENYETELGLTLSEITHTLRHLKKWMKPDRVSTPLAHFPSSSYILKQPKGVVLIMSPWNYPLLLSLTPLVAALSAGCCVVLKPSRYSENTSRVLKDMFDSEFDERLVKVFEGGHEANTQLLEIRWDHIFFTGSPNVGKVVMQAAAKNLTPVTLELGGKSPCIVAEDADIRLSARRIAFGKLLNSGQTCVAPDYVLVHPKIRADFVRALEEETVRMYGENPLSSPDYPKMINRRQFDRVIRLIDPSKVVFGGGYDENSLKIMPTVLENVSFEDEVMREEIFGPVLPVLEAETLEDVKSAIARNPSPLALYWFGKDKKAAMRAVREISFGGGCLNDTVMHLATHELGFGGVGESGTGAYHGARGFFAFSHVKSILDKSLKLDLPYRYAPFSAAKEKVIRKNMK